MSPEAKGFGYKTQQQDFDYVFPPEKVMDFEDGGSSDWIGIFDALDAFGFGIVPEGQEKVQKMILAHPEASTLIPRPTPEGLMIYRRNVTPLLKTIFCLGLETMPYWNEKSRERIDEAKRYADKAAMESILRAQKDWEK